MFIAMPTVSESIRQIESREITLTAMELIAAIEVGYFTPTEFEELHAALSARACGFWPRGKPTPEQPQTDIDGTPAAD